MANIKITDLDAYSDPKSTDVLPAVDVTNDETKKVSIADLMENAGSGTEALPGISFDGDPNTGIYRPGADKVAISTGGTGRLFIDAVGNVGLGTSSPGYNLHISPATGAAQVKIAGAEGEEASIRLYADQGDDAADIKRLLTDTSGNFKIQHYSGASFVDSLVIDSSGRVGINTASPGKLLAVEGSSTPGIRVKTTSASSYSTCEAINNADDYIQLFANGSSRAAFGALDTGETGLVSSKSVSIMAANSNQVIKFATGGSTERLRITANGNLGLGTSSPNKKLHVVVDTNDPTTASPSSGSFIQAEGSTTTVGNGPSFALANASGAKETYWRISAVTASGNNGDLVFNGYNGGANYPERLRITASGNVGIGTTSPGNLLSVYGDMDVGNGNKIKTTSSGGTLQIQGGALYPGGNILLGGGSGNNDIRFGTSGASPTSTERARITSDGKLGVGTSSPTGTLEVGAVSGSVTAGDLTVTTGSTTAEVIVGRLSSLSNDATTFRIRDRVDRDVLTANIGGFIYSQAGQERFRCDNNGRLLLGTSTAISTFNYGGGDRTPKFQLSGDDTNNGSLAVVRTQTAPNIIFGAGTSGTNVASNNSLGSVVFTGYHTDKYYTGGFIRCEVDGTPGANDMPGRLEFSTTADGASSPTERMRITSGGDVIIGKTSTVNTTNGIFITGVETGNTTAVLSITNTEATDTSAGLLVNRQGSDGRLVQFRQNNTVEGTISVSGTTVTYGGGHLARWSQLLNKEDPSGILKGTVMSNLDEMCEWGEEDNEQLNKTKVSDVEGDPNVAGVFVSTSFDEKGPEDFFVAMTGDMVIRIAQGVTVERGDLLMSAGDGTAKPQDDDIIRSKTVAKVTSTHVSETYADGSYCVPCVLMAC
jgi:hypothetical protein